jgi:hypothetical protein
MKKSIRFIPLLLSMGAAFMFQACSDDDAGSASFSTVYASYDEADGEGTVTAPIRKNGSVNDGDIKFVLGGTATEGEDYEFLGLTSEGVQIRVLDNDDYTDYMGFEPNETVTVRLDGPASGNKVFELTIVGDCDYKAEYFDAEYYAGAWSALEDYGGATYGPYDVELVQDEANPNRFDFDNFYDSGLDAYIVFDGPNGTVKFPDGQTPGGKALTNSSGTFDQCSGVLTVYRFNKQ